MSVAVPVPALDLLTYRVPDGSPTPRRRARGRAARAPTLTGVVIGRRAPPRRRRRLRDVIEVLDDDAVSPA